LIVIPVDFTIPCSIEIHIYKPDNIFLKYPVAKYICPTSILNLSQLYHFFASQDTKDLIYYSLNHIIYVICILLSLFNTFDMFDTKLRIKAGVFHMQTGVGLISPAIPLNGVFPDTAEMLANRELTKL
jgi:hypothetical protein